MLKKISRYYHTIRYLRWTQIYYRIYYLVRKKVRKTLKYTFTPFIAYRPVTDLPQLKSSITSYKTYLGNNAFQFINLTHSFEETIDWNFEKHGKLWAYNLNYFEYLHQANMDKTTGLALIHGFIRQYSANKVGSEPFPISLRLIFWIRFLIKYEINDDSIHQSIWLQSHQLVDQREFHLLGNHLLENGFGLFFAAHYLKDKYLLEVAKKILDTELQEQVLADGAHFELSPMYHQLMLYRILDCINLLQNNPTFNNKLLPLLESKAAIMLGWLQQMTFTNGDIPHFNDSTVLIAPTTKSLMQYAKQLNIFTERLPLGESGYRCFSNEKYELKVDVGNIGPNYIPGHAHSDTFSFVLHIDNLPVIVDTGISTYEMNKLRQTERSTLSHNTVFVEEQEQSDVWGGFRVGRRAFVTILKDEPDFVKATHTGYIHLGSLHCREFSFGEKHLLIKDTLTSSLNAKSIFWFAPTIDIEINMHNMQVVVGQFLTLSFKNALRLEILCGNIAYGFNKQVETKFLEVHFTNQLEILLTL